MSKQLNHNVVDMIESDLQKVEADLERIGRTICDVNGGLTSWDSINDSVLGVQNAIRECWRMRPS